ncbi:MAG TPA: oligosaccharyl transferase, archaeosortase A system-associated [Methanocella sp.]|nr:oligosaccharyl transferase, archaeosortase A system-associated [Methanocella sp.]
MSSSKKKSRQLKQKHKEAQLIKNGVPKQPVPEQPSVKPLTGSPKPETQQAPSVADKKRFGMPSTPILLLLGIIIVGLFFRMLPTLYAIRNGHILFTEFDPYYHMRRITFTVHNFPFANFYDAYVNYPNGYFVGWPPLFDVIAAGLSLVFGLGSPNQFTIELVSALLPVGMGLLAIVAAYYFVKEVFNEKVGLLAAFVMALLPASVFRSTFADTDHHVFEVLLSLTLLVLFARALSRGKVQGLSFGNISKIREPAIYAGLAGVIIAAMVYSFDIAPVYIAVIPLYAFVQYALDAMRSENSEYLSVAGVIASIVALLLILPGAATTYQGARFEVSGIYLSWFQVIIMAVIAIFFLGMYVFRRVAISSKAPWFAQPAGLVIAGLAITVLVMVAMPSTFANIENGVTYLSGSSLVLSSVAEVTPLLMYGGQFSLGTSVLNFSTAALLSIAGAIIFLYSMAKKKQTNAEILFLVWSVVIFVIGLLQSRFLYILGALAAIYAGYCIYRLLAASGLNRYLEMLGDQSPKRKKARVPQMLIISTVLVILLLLIPAYTTAVRNDTELEMYTVDWNDAALWLRDHTPATSYLYAQGMDKMPEYSVMTWWDYGNYVLYPGERPSVSNNFQTGIQDSAQFFLAQNESAADQIMDSHNSRYVMVDKRMTAHNIDGGNGIFENMPILAKDDPYTYFTTYRMPNTVGGSDMKLEGTGKYYGTMFSRLYYNCGLGGQNPIGGMDSGLEHYRLAYMTHGIDPVLVFEYVKGATITGNAQPGAKVMINLNVTSGNVTKTYYNETKADATTGAYRFTVPYPTGEADDIHTTPEYTIMAGGSSTVKVQVPLDAVRKGETITAAGGV